MIAQLFDGGDGCDATTVRVASVLSNLDCLIQSCFSDVSLVESGQSFAVRGERFCEYRLFTALFQRMHSTPRNSFSFFILPF